jgi:hypothetical protein
MPISKEEKTAAEVKTDQDTEVIKPDQDPERTAKHGLTQSLTPRHSIHMQV